MKKPKKYYRRQFGFVPAEVLDGSKLDNRIGSGIYSGKVDLIISFVCLTTAALSGSSPTVILSLASRSYRIDRSDKISIGFRE